MGAQHLRVTHRAENAGMPAQLTLEGAAPVGVEQVGIRAQSAPEASYRYSEDVHIGRPAAHPLLAVAKRAGLYAEIVERQGAESAHPEIVRHGVWPGIGRVESPAAIVAGPLVIIAIMRWPPIWTQSGRDPDYRFSLANERTFLAWIRTSLAVLAAAVAVVQLVSTHHLHEARRALGILLALLGVAMSASAYSRWSANERAMREGRPLPRSPLLVVVSAVLAIVAVLVLAVAVFA
jgi:putative membrane protein